MVCGLILAGGRNAAWYHRGLQELQRGPQGHSTHGPSSGTASMAARSASFSANKPCSQTRPSPAPLLMAALPLDIHGWNCSRELLKTREVVFKPETWLAPSLCDREQCIRYYYNVVTHEGKKNREKGKNQLIW